MKRAAPMALPADLIVGESMDGYRERKDKGLTPEFPPNIQPARDGVYMVKIGRCWHYSFWINGRWHYTARTPELCQTWKRSIDCYSPSFTGWRGLATDPAPDRRPGVGDMTEYLRRALGLGAGDATHHAKQLWALAHPKVAA